MTEAGLRRTRLYDWHVQAGARMVEFAGWEMPVQYPTGPIEEHKRVRAAAGLFDIAHMGRFRISGPHAEAFLQAVQTWDIRRTKVHEAHYALLCYDDGGVVDDVFLYHLPDGWLMVVNAANKEKDLAWLQAHVGDADVILQDVSDEMYMVALQGPLAQAILQRVTDVDLARLPFHGVTHGMVAGVSTLIGATGYTGEYGYELLFPVDEVRHVWEALLEAGEPEGLIPCGLAARDTLRAEVCLPLYGHELHAEIDPISAGLKFAVRFDKGDFLGRNALLKVHLEGPVYRLVAFEMVDRGVPRQGYEVVAGDIAVGEVTTGLYSPSTGRYVGMAYVLAEYAAVGTELAVVIRERPRAARVVRRPFYTPAYRRK
ncbi:MAG TPA: glycine cleavage system aminomethyltransferase GcvT [Caldilineae bacterium]|nr:glycine cleavage system aminomethyltransferase GcvT [Caldilineae bacterium]